MIPFSTIAGGAAIVEVVIVGSLLRKFTLRLVMIYGKIQTRHHRIRLPAINTGSSKLLLQVRLE